MTERLANRVWLMRAMCHVDQCKCADRGGMADDYDACRIISRHANAIIKRNGADGETSATAKEG